VGRLVAAGVVADNDKTELPQLLAETRQRLRVLPKPAGNGLALQQFSDGREISEQLLL